MIRENYLEVKKNIEETLAKKGRPIDDVTLVCVTKLHDMDEIMQAIDAGATNVGENKVQEFLRKNPYFPKNVHRHFQGTLQTNKVKDIIGKVDLIHSMDRLSLLKELEKRGAKENIVSNVLIQLNISGEETKGGFTKEELEGILEEIEKCSFVRVKGLMTMAPHRDNPNEIRWVFTEMKAIFDRLKEKSFKNTEMVYLSMGMTNDYIVAIEEGSNMVRVGTAIFGQRDYSKK